MSSDLAYLHPNARIDLHNAIVAAGIRPVVVQTLGSAPESAGTHGKSGTYTATNGKPHSYSGAIDWSVIQDATRIDPVTYKGIGKVKMGDDQIKWWLWKAGEHNIAAFYRRPSQGFTAQHIHGITCSCHLLTTLQRQVVDWLTGKDGLRRHRDETYWLPPESTEAKLKETFLHYNPECAGWFE